MNHTASPPGSLNSFSVTRLLAFTPNFTSDCPNKTDGVVAPGQDNEVGVSAAARPPARGSPGTQRRGLHNVASATQRLEVCLGAGREKDLRGLLNRACTVGFDFFSIILNIFCAGFMYSANKFG